MEALQLSTGRNKSAFAEPGVFKTSPILLSALSEAQETRNQSGRFRLVCFKVFETAICGVDVHTTPTGCWRIRRGGARAEPRPQRILRAGNSLTPALPRANRHRFNIPAARHQQTACLQDPQAFATGIRILISSSCNLLPSSASGTHPPHRPGTGRSRLPTG